MGDFYICLLVDILCVLFQNYIGLFLIILFFNMISGTERDAPKVRKIFISIFKLHMMMRLL